MGNDIKSGVGYLIPLGAVIGFVAVIVTGNYLLSILIPLAGILVWFIYMKIMEVPVPDMFGNIIIAFGGLLAVGVFLVYGTKLNMFGGIEIQEEGAVFALLVLFFSILTGMLFNRNDGLGKNLLTGEEKELVNKAIKKSDNEVSPRVIVVKQEAEQKEEKNNQPDEYTPYYAYPPEYDYYDDYYEDEEEDDEDE
jgi:hypothetical protein